MVVWSLCYRVATQHHDELEEEEEEEETLPQGLGLIIGTFESVRAFPVPGNKKVTAVCVTFASTCASAPFSSSSMSDLCSRGMITLQSSSWKAESDDSFLYRITMLDVNTAREKDSEKDL